MENPLHILLLLVLGALLLFVLDVYGGGAFFGRLKAREFRTRAAPFFLLIPGLGLATCHPVAAGAVFCLAAAPYVTGRIRRGRCCAGRR
jgi:hypothetical protein